MSKNLIKTKKKKNEINEKNEMIYLSILYILTYMITIQQCMYAYVCTSILYFYIQNSRTAGEKNILTRIQIRIHLRIVRVFACVFVICMCNSPH